jgi:acetoacetate decarboxylase
VEPADVVKTAFAMPLTSPSFARGPYSYTNSEYMVVTYRMSRTALEEAVPEPLPFDEPLVRCTFMRTESSTGFGRYSGAAQHIAVRFNGQSGAYIHNMYLDAYAPISGGRELWGFPQKLAKPRLAVEHDTLVGTLDHGPVQVAKGTMGYKHRTLAQETAAGMLAEWPSDWPRLRSRPTRPETRDRAGKTNRRLRRGQRRAKNILPVFSCSLSR